MTIAAGLEYDRLFIGGEWLPSAGAETIDVINPATEEVIGHAPHASAADVDRAVAAAREAFDHGDWPRLALEERVAALERIRDIYATRLDQVADVITAEMGSPRTFSRALQTPLVVALIDYYLELARSFPFEEVRGAIAGTALVIREPVGVVAAISPWNAPQVTTVAKLIPALLAGCTVIVKPAPETPIDGLMLAEVCEQAGLPPGVLSVLPAGREIGEYLVTHAGVDKVAFTGSTAAGRRIASLCGQDLRRVTLELGGKSAAILLDDADLDAAVEGMRMLSLANSGQICANHTRVIVPETRQREIVERMVAMLEEMPVGDPTDPVTEVGPLATARQRERVEGYIAAGRSEGATLAHGGSRPTHLSAGWYVEPTIFTGVDNGMRIAREEIFGPVLAVIPYGDIGEAIEIANDSSYGLSGGVWSGEPGRALEVARRIRTGQVSVNGAPGGMQAPFGGFKQSGLGRELGPEGLQSFLETKSVAITAEQAQALARSHTGGR